MTSNNRFKRRVRNRAAKTGESYTTALNRSRSGDKEATKTVIEALLRPTAHLALELASETQRDELDAVQEANLVLMHLVEGDDPTVSDRLGGAIRAKLSTP